MDATIDLPSPEPTHMVFGHHYVVVDHDRRLVIHTKPSRWVFGRRCLETRTYTFRALRLQPKE